MLYILNQSHSSNALHRCLQIAGCDDAILLIEDGVLAAINNSDMASLISSLAKKCEIFVLHADVEARGLSAMILANIKIIDYDGFVDLTIKHSPIVSL